MFLTGVLGVTDVGAYFPHRVTYHPSCHSLRMLQVGDAPLRLLRAVRGLDLADLPDAEVCCGFGGTFAVKNPDVSAAICADKVTAVRQTGAEVLCAADNFVAGQRQAAPVHGDVGEQPVLDPVPFRCPRREVAHRDREPRLQREGGELGLPRAGAVAVGAARVRGDQQPPGPWVGSPARRVPPAADRFDGERGGVVVGAGGTQPAFAVRS